MLVRDDRDVRRTYLIYLFQLEVERKNPRPPIHHQGQDPREHRDSRYERRDWFEVEHSDLVGMKLEVGKVEHR